MHATVATLHRKPSPLQPMVARKDTPVRIHLVDKPATKSALPPDFVAPARLATESRLLQSSKAGRATGSKTRRLAAATQPKARSAIGRAYTDLFPNADWQPAEGTAPTGARISRRASPEAMATGDRMAGVFDIPLTYRNTDTSAKAIAVLMRRADSTWYFESIDGDPVLRAVLFEGLRTPHNQGLVLALFQDLGSHEITITLHQRTEQKTGIGSSYLDTYHIDGHKLVIERIRYVDRMRATVTDPTGIASLGVGIIPLNIPLPDREAERARERDHGARAKLEESPAFHGAIRDREP